MIAKVQGAAVAAGCQLVATCDLAYAAETAKFGVNGINLGLFCATPSVALSRAVAPRQALDLLLTGRLIPASRAAEIGLVNASVPAEALDGVVAETAALIAAKLPAGDRTRQGPVQSTRWGSISARPMRLPVSAWPRTWAMGKPGR